MTAAGTTDTDWGQFATMTMPVFLERFTLHDSWIKDVVVWPYGGQVTLTIGFDLHWNDSVPDGFDTLFLHFDRAYSQRFVLGAWAQQTISDASSQVLSEEERDELLRSAEFDLRAYQGARDKIPHPAYETTLTRTVFSLMNWGLVECLHGSSIRCIVANAGGSQVDLTNMMPPQARGENGA